MEEKPKINVVMIRSTSIYNDSRILKEARALTESGYSVTILGWDRDGYAQGKVGTENDFCDCIYFFERKAKYGSGIKNLINILKFENWIISTLKKMKSIDIIHACDYDTARVVSKYAKKNNIKFVYDIFDYYIDCHNIPVLLKKIIERDDCNIINSANYTLICTEERRKQIKMELDARCVVIHNSPEIPSFENQANICKSNNNKFKIVYVGILQSDRLLKEVANEIIKKEDIELHIGGFGLYEDYFEKLSQKYENIYFYGQMDYIDVLKLESECDLLFATYNPQVPNHRYSAPNKIYEALELNKKIIACKDTGLDNIVNEMDGILISYDANEFVNAVEYFQKHSTNSILKKNEYSWSEMKKRLLNIYATLSEQ